MAAVVPKEPLYVATTLQLSCVSLRGAVRGRGFRLPPPPQPGGGTGFLWRVPSSGVGLPVGVTAGDDRRTDDGVGRNRSDEPCLLVLLS